MICFSCKNKNSNERCLNKPLKNLRFCGVHARSKNKKLWIDIPKFEKQLIIFQGRFRGWLIRDTLKLRGPGVLKRSECHNTEDLVTCEEKDEISIKNYFAFEESGKIYWFDVRTIFEWSCENLEPTNPYTKQPLTIETRKRLKKLICRYEYFSYPTHHDPQYYEKTDKIKFCWYQIIQILNENLFADITEPYFLMLNEFQIIDFSKNILSSIESWDKSKNELLNYYYALIEFSCNLIELDFFRGYIPFLVSILGVLRINKIQYEFSFKLLGARAIMV